MLITFEGVNGAGKSYQIEQIHQWLVNNNISNTKIHNPGFTPVGKVIRELLLTKSVDLDQHTELLLFIADRTETQSDIVKHVNNGSFVLCDRYIDSSIAFQGYGRQMDLGLVTHINNIFPYLTPTITFLFDIDPTIGLLRKGTNLDKMESEDISFHNRVRNGYLNIAAANPERVIIIDASLSKEHITEFIKHEIKTRYKLHDTTY